MLPIHREELSWTTGLVALAVLAAGLRLTHLLEYAQHPIWHDLTVDNHYWYNWAVWIKNGGWLGETTYFRAPLYPFALAGWQWLFGEGLWPARLLGIASGVVTVLVTCRLGRHLFGVIPGLFAGLLVAVSPVMIYYESEILAESPFALTLVAALWLSIRAGAKLTTGRVFWAAAIWCLAALLRPTALLGLPWLVLYLWWEQRETPHLRWQPLVPIIGATLLFLGPVITRNYLVAEDITPIATQGGINFYLGNHAEADGASAIMPEPYGFNWQLTDIAWIAENDEGAALTPAAVSRYWFGRGLIEIGGKPLNWAVSYLKRIGFYLLPDELANNRAGEPWLPEFQLLSWLPVRALWLVPLGIIGLVLTWRRSSVVGAIGIWLIGFVVITALFFVNSRFRMPLLPIFALGVSGFAWWITAQIRERHWTGLALGIGSALVLLFAVHFLPLPSAPTTTAAAEAASTRGLRALRANDYPAAESAFRRARELAPDRPEVNLNLGAAWMRLGLVDSARSAFAAEVERWPDRSAGWTSYASSLILTGDTSAAIEAAQRAVMLRPYDETTTRLAIRLAPLHLTSTGELIDLLALAWSRTDSSIGVAREAADVWTTLGDTTRAVRWLLRAEESRPGPMEISDQLFRPDYLGWLDNWRQQQAEAATQRSLLEARRGNLVEATRAAARAVELDSTFVPGWVNLISGHWTTGARRRADSLFVMASERFPGHPTLRRLAPLLGR